MKQARLEKSCRTHLKLAPQTNYKSISWLTPGLRSAELKGPRKLVRIRPEVFDFDTGLGLKLGQTIFSHSQLEQFDESTTYEM